MVLVTLTHSSSGRNRRVFVVALVPAAPRWLLHELVEYLFIFQEVLQQLSRVPHLGAREWWRLEKGNKVHPHK